MSKHRYILEPYKAGINSRYTCPNCQQIKKFSLYIDTVTGKHVHPTVGRCDRESNCGNHYTPKQYFQENNIPFDTLQFNQYTPRPIATKAKPISFIPDEDFKASLTDHEKNHFVKFLISLFGFKIASDLIRDYFIGTSKHWDGATVFWQIDIKGKVRTGKIIQYEIIDSVDSIIGEDCKRNKTNFPPVYWVHSALKIADFKQCFFGEHLLIDKTKPVAIVESEKTAVIASIYRPQFIWLAAGSKEGLSAEKCSVLKGRTVVLFPDIDGFEKWSSKANELSHIAKFNVFDLLELKATEAERMQQLDIADYLIKLNLEDFTERKSEYPNPPQTVQAIFKSAKFEHPTSIEYFSEHEHPKPECWEQEIEELENYFKSIELPTQPVILNSCKKISNCSSFIETNIATVKANNGKSTFLPYLNRLQELKQILTINLKQHECK
ncbi:DUF6965 family protein [Flavobacterium sp.]|jgi:hypothetical protein|uniref:DUF6965 family protein n=1 Tax=Flavobacterium sp. TaxID=239 RepID=UPI0037BEA53A